MDMSRIQKCNSVVLKGKNPEWPGNHLTENLICDVVPERVVVLFWHDQGSSKYPYLTFWQPILCLVIFRIVRLRPQVFVLL